jgi:hypothetical protein
MWGCETWGRMMGLLGVGVGAWYCCIPFIACQSHCIFRLWIMITNGIGRLNGNEIFLHCRLSNIVRYRLDPFVTFWRLSGKSIWIGIAFPWKDCSSILGFSHTSLRMRWCRSQVWRESSNSDLKRFLNSHFSDLGNAITSNIVLYFKMSYAGKMAHFRLSDLARIKFVLWMLHDCWVRAMVGRKRVK